MTSAGFYSNVCTKSIGYVSCNSNFLIEALSVEVVALERAMGIEPKHDFRYVPENVGCSCELPSKTVHNG